MGVEFEPLSNRWQQDPYPTYRELRDSAPVHYAPESGRFVLARHDDVLHALKTPEIYSSKIDPRKQMSGDDMGILTQIKMAVTMLIRLRVSPLNMRNSRFLISEGGEVHAAMRAIVNRGFTPRRIAKWEERAVSLAAAGVEKLRSGEPFDVMHDLAIPLPVTLIAEMLGVESERMHDFKRWSDALISGGTGSAAKSGGGPMFAAMQELRDYLRPILRTRRATPENDLISILVMDEGPAALSDFEVFQFILLLLLAGNETTTNLLGNAVDALLQHPDQLSRVQADPKLIPSLVEEVLRWDSPVQMVQRVLTQEVELHGVSMPKGAMVSLMIGSANRDERRFSNPDRFDVGRDEGAHLSFGFGIHFCLGSSLARLEARAALEALVPELHRFERANPEREFVDSFVVRGVRRLELRAA